MRTSHISISILFLSRPITTIIASRRFMLWDLTITEDPKVIFSVRIRPNLWSCDGLGLAGLLSSLCDVYERKNLVRCDSLVFFILLHTCVVFLEQKFLKVLHILHVCRLYLQYLWKKTVKRQKTAEISISVCATANWTQ